MRIASLLSSATEMVCALGLESSLVGISHECDFPPSVTSHAASHAIAHRGRRLRAARSTSKCMSLMAEGAPLFALDVELLAACQPDLIVTQAQCDVCAVRYEDVVAAVAGHASLVGTKVLALNPQSLADVIDDVARLGDATGTSAEARRLAGRAGSAHRRGRARRPPIVAAATRPRVAMVEWIEPLMLSGNWVPEVVSLAGGRHDLTVAGQYSIYVPWDDLRAYDPEAIVIVPCGFDLARTLSCRQILTSCQAGES